MRALKDKIDGRLQQIRSIHTLTESLSAGHAAARLLCSRVPTSRHPLRVQEVLEAWDLCAPPPIDLRERPDLDRGRKRSPLRLAQARDAARQSRQRYL